MSAESGLPQPDARLPIPEYIPRGTYTPPAYTPVPPPSEWHHGHYAEAAAAPVAGSGSGSRNRGRGLAGGAAAIGAVLLKLGPALFKFKAVLYLLINVGVYAFFFGSNFGLIWALALGLGILVLLFLHETGHMVAAEIEGVPVSAPNFIPGFGAYIMLKAQPRDAKTESIIAIGGPLFGALASLATIGLANTVGTDTKLGLLLAVVAGYSFFFNAINMIPYSPLDGGRILGSVSKWVNVIGLAMLVGGIVFGYLSPIFLILILFLGGASFSRFRHPENPGYYSVSPRDRALIGAAYLTILAILVIGVLSTGQYIEAAQVGGGIH
ncbi:MAG TPA: site-2 protease family protein [Candidatus Solibacter sp.]|jgi:Zn-dependent protease|nr:site-2 protease family protein [Candidatus Solibacter sp.]